MSSIDIIRPFHPFPARMAPDIALNECVSLSLNSTIMDPMAGSGTVLRLAAQTGHKAIGFDIDPLAILLAKTWTTPIDPERLLRSSENIVNAAKDLKDREINLPWIDENEETTNFINYWFASPQKEALRKLSYLLFIHDGPEINVLRVALSRMIITKSRGASLAADVSHSRPHRVKKSNNFDVINEFLRSCNFILSRFQENMPFGDVTVALGDARHLYEVQPESIDAVITSPPYLNAIDYLRGHRLSLVWLGYSVETLRRIRSVSVGAEKGPDRNSNLDLAEHIASLMGNLEELPRHRRRMIFRYVIDLNKIISEISRVLKIHGVAVFVIGNSQQKGVYIKNTEAVIELSRANGLNITDKWERSLPPSKRYLPPPVDGDVSSLEKRMRTEVVLKFNKE